MDELIAVEPAQRRVRLLGGTSVDYDMLSLNVGSTLAAPTTSRARVLALRPLGALRQAWDPVLGELMRAPATSTPLVLTAVGGGAAGVESLLGVRARLLQVTKRPVHAGLVTSGLNLLDGMAPGAVRRVERALAAADVTVQLGTRYGDPVGASSDLLLWATGALAHPWQRTSGFAVSAAGFIRIDRRLRSVSHPEAYAVGDCAEWAVPLPKAGVYAVRMGPMLARNLRAALGQGTAVDYEPQRRFLALMATGDGRAVASYGRWSASGRWVWRWKDRIDRGFVAGFGAGAEATVPAVAQTPR